MRVVFAACANVSKGTIFFPLCIYWNLNENFSHDFEVKLHSCLKLPKKKSLISLRMIDLWKDSPESD